MNKIISMLVFFGVVFLVGCTSVTQSTNVATDDAGQGLTDLDPVDSVEANYQFYGHT